MLIFFSIDTAGLSLQYVQKLLTTIRDYDNLLAGYHNRITALDIINSIHKK